MSKEDNMNVLSKICGRIKNLSSIGLGNLLMYIVVRCVSSVLQRRGVTDTAGNLLVQRRQKAYFVKSPRTYRTLVSVGGFGWSGSSAVVELLREYSGVTTQYTGVASNPALQPKARCFEFELARAAGGLFNLEHVFATRNFFERDAAVRIFCALAERLYLDSSAFYGDDFVELTKEFLSGIIVGKGVNEGGGFDYCHHLSTLGTSATDRFIGKPDDIRKKYLYYLKDIDIAEYRKRARDYLTEVLRRIDSEDCLVLDQATSDDCFDISRYREYFGPIKTVFVWRDPSEVYAASQMYENNEAFFPKAPDEYVVWYREVLQRALSTKHDMWLAVRFEDLLYSYEEQVSRIERFLGLRPECHVRKFSSFVPEQSIARSMGHWRRYPDREAIQTIREGLKEFCYNPPNNIR